MKNMTDKIVAELQRELDEVAQAKVNGEYVDGYVVGLAKAISIIKQHEKKGGRK